MKKDYRIELEEELKKRGIELQSEQNYADNIVRFFKFKGQKIYFDDEFPNCTTTSFWDEERIKNMIFVIDHVKEKVEDIYYKMGEDTCEYFSWGEKEYLLSVDFMGYFVIYKGKICKEIG